MIPSELDPDLNSVRIMQSCSARRGDLLRRAADFNAYGSCRPPLVIWDFEIRGLRVQDWRFVVWDLWFEIFKLCEAWDLRIEGEGWGARVIPASMVWDWCWDLRFEAGRSEIWGLRGSLGESPGRYPGGSYGRPFWEWKLKKGGQGIWGQNRDLEVNGG